MALQLLKSESTKKHFSYSKGIPLDALKDQNFNLEKVMGDVIFEGKHLDLFGAVNDILQEIFPGEGVLLDRIKDSELWRLSMRRHLIVHRRGEVDMAYDLRAGESLDRRHAT